MSLPIPEELVGTTQALFYEFRHQTTSQVPAPYNLKETDWEGTQSMYQIYMAHDTEYDAAMALLGSWMHWEKLCKSPWFIKHKEKWDAEKEVIKQAIAEKTLIEQAKAGNVQAAKLLRDGKTKPTAAKRGRPHNHKEDEEQKKTADVVELEKLSARIQRIK